MFALGLLAHNLQVNGIEIGIEKNESIDEELLNENITSLQFITNSMNEKKKYDLHFDLEENKTEEYLNDPEKFEKFKDKLKEKLSKDYNIPKEKIIVTFPQKGSLSVQIIFQNDEFNNLNLQDFKSKFKNDKNFPEIPNFKIIHTNVIMGVCKLRKSHLDSRGNRIDGWGINEKRANEPYIPPLGWIGIGLKVLGQYDGGDDKWIGMNNSEGEWCVAYHGLGRWNTSDEVKKITRLIYEGEFKKGPKQALKNYDDKFHPGKKIGTGVYCTPNIQTAEKYAGISIINGKRYKTALMVRVKKDARRGCTDSFCDDYWVVNGTKDEIRPYRILYKNINN